MIIQFCIQECISYSLSLRAAKIILAIVQISDKKKDYFFQLKRQNNDHLDIGWLNLLRDQEQIGLDYLLKQENKHYIDKQLLFKKVFKGIEEKKEASDELQEEIKKSQNQIVHKIYFLKSQKDAYLIPNNCFCVFLDDLHFPQAEFLENAAHALILSEKTEHKIQHKKVTYLPCFGSEVVTKTASDCAEMLILIGTGNLRLNLTFLEWADRTDIPILFLDPYSVPDDYGIHKDWVSSFYKHMATDGYWMDFIPEKGVCLPIDLNKDISDQFCCEMRYRGIDDLREYSDTDKSYWTDDDFTSSIYNFLNKKHKTHSLAPTVAVSEVSQKILESLLAAECSFDNTHISCLNHRIHIISDTNINQPNINYDHLIFNMNPSVSEEEILLKIMIFVLNPSVKSLLFNVTKNCIIPTLIARIPHDFLDINKIKLCHSFADCLETLLKDTNESQCALFVDSSGYQEAKKHIDAIHLKSLAPAEDKKPNIIISGNSYKPDYYSFSQSKIGVSVATDYLAKVLLKLRDSVKLLWHRKQPSSSDLGRLCFYPYETFQGDEQDEFDSASMPNVLQQREIDLLLQTHAHLSSGLLARDYWAQEKHMPVVGLLHATHIGSLLTDLTISFSTTQFRKYDAIISPSFSGKKSYESCREYIVEHLKGRLKTQFFHAYDIEVIPYGILYQHYEKSHQLSARKYLNIPVDCFTILSIGRIHQQDKADLTSLLYTVYLLKKENPNVFVIIAGEDSGTGTVAYLKNLAAALHLNHNIWIKTDLDHSYKAYLLNAADVFVSISDSIQETHGMSLLEAMSAELPIVASNWNGYREIVEHEKSGLLANTYMGSIPEEVSQLYRVANDAWGNCYHDLGELVAVDPYHLLSHLKTIRDYPEFAQKMGEEAKKRVVECFDAHKQTQKIVDFLISRIKAAKHCTDYIPYREPFFDPLQKRYAHYPQPNTSFSSMLWQKSPWLSDAKLQKIIAERIHMKNSKRTKMVEYLIDILPDYPQSLSGRYIIDYLHEKGCDTCQLENELWRCMKYGLMQNMQ